MARGDKFIQLRNYFGACGASSLSLSFDEIESILGDPLCPSAYQYPAYWTSPTSHPFPLCWINEGYKLKHLDLTNKSASWERNNKEDTLPITSHSSVAKPITSQITHYTLSAVSAVSKVNSYYQEIQSGENGRYKSWEHCYSYFAKHRNQLLSDEHIDLLCLHLAFYLASWGMYRGSSFLLQRDYRIHHDVVIEIFSERYAPLWGVSSESLMEQETLDLLFNLVKRIEDIYIEKRAGIDGRKSVSETLLTKVLLGTLGCVPAYDRYFIAAIRKHKIASGQFNKASISSLAHFHFQNQSAFSSCCIRIEGIDYPPMKIIDMCFWQIGYESETHPQEEHQLL